MKNYKLVLAWSILVAFVIGLGILTGWKPLVVIIGLGCALGSLFWALGVILTHFDDGKSGMEL